MSNMELNVAEAKKRFSELLNRVGFGREKIVIARRGKPIAMLVPPVEDNGPDHLSKVEGWLNDDDPFFAIVNQTVNNRKKHPPRILKDLKE